MPTPFVRYRSDAKAEWGELLGDAPRNATDRIHVSPLAQQPDTTAALLAANRRTSGRTVEISAGALLSPVTGDRQVICQGLNYGTHSAESGHTTRAENLFFMKAASALSGPFDDIVRPPEVELLDYEVEIGLVIRSTITAPLHVTDEDIGRHVAGVVLCNDISARDIMFGAPFFQWFQGKSYRGFCPTGPVLWLFEPDEAKEFLGGLAITLDWNAERRQSANTAELLYRPAETITRLSGIVDLHPGDLLLTGTPGGTIAHGTAKVVEILATKIVADTDRRAALRTEMLKHSRFLEPGDVIETEMRASRTSRPLGGQRNRIAAG